jgi:predicted CXXCH cytochrome family protein
MKANARKFIWLLAVSGCLSGLVARGDSIVNSKHNLSANGPGTIKAGTEQNLCVFCHTVHHANGQTPLWNHQMSSVTNYITYTSGTLKAVVGQPDGSSRLCLSCHDGTVALGMVSSRTNAIAMQNGVTTMPTGPSNLGTDLSGDHPISFKYDTTLTKLDTQLQDPATLTGKVRLDHNNEVQCTSCHDPHNDQFGNFMVVDNSGSALCLACHTINNWSGSVHALSSQTVSTMVMQKMTQRAPAPGKSALKSPTVAQQGCENCHAPHLAGSKERLMRFAAPEQNCLVCHNGSMNTKNVAADFQKISVHPITLNGTAHSPQEDPINPKVRHVTCSDCHDPHGSTTAPGTSAKVIGALNGVVGVSANGAVIKSVNKEYELCFRCHGDSLARGKSRVNRQTPETNKRLQFSSANQSFHPIETIGKSRNVPSLIAPWTVSSVMACTDCHNSDQSPGAGGSGANGPHGSVFTPLLERQLVTTDYSAESMANYALCYKCHSRDSILADQSFHAVNSLGQDRGHRFHIVDQKTACTTCHDSHGVLSAKHLINFNSDYVTASSSLPSGLMYTSTGTSGGVCTLTCHGKDHAGTAYGGAGSPFSGTRIRGRGLGQ